MSTDKEKVTRKLKAILSADVKGYSLLVTDDEVLTLKTLNEYRDIMSELIKSHSGRVVDAVGDNLLAEFSSAVDAVNCAFKIQVRLKKENSKFVDGRKLQFRIGINIGDVIHQDDRLIGEGVNIASRIESLSDAGGICISRNTYDHIKNKLQVETKYLGEHQVKNINEPVRVYKIIMGNEEYEPLVKEKLELPAKPSVAVLPFTNMSGDPTQEYFSDGLTEQIINGLCKVSNLFVIARNSSFAYKSKAVSIKKIAQELGVKYILEGSVQKAGDRVRITAQLIDATTDYHMWSENYDRNLHDIFVLQDEITLKLIEIMHVKLIFGEEAYNFQDIKNIKAYDKFMRGLEYLRRHNEHYNAQARNYFEQASKLDESSAAIIIGLGLTYFFDYFYNWGNSPKESFINMEKCSDKAFELNDSLSLAYELSALITFLNKDFDGAIEKAEKAVALNPNGAEAISCLAFISCFAGDPDRALNIMQRAFRLNPIPPSQYYHILGIAYSMVGQIEEAINFLYKGVSIDPNPISQYLTLATCYILLKKTDKAKKMAGRVLELDPNFSVKYYTSILPYQNQQMLEVFVDSLRKAGLPD